MNRCQFSVFLGLLAVTTIACAKKCYGPGEQDWGFFNVRRGAHMFYWLYRTSADVNSLTQRPLVIWLQGGPGGSSTGYGNFEEIGPLDLNGNYRDTNWVKDVNVLFIDNPVGTGFSYVDDISYLTANNTEIALDLVEFMRRFYQVHPVFISVPLHIFSESYGGKMAAEFALELHKAIKQNTIKCKLSSVALGDAWISPIDSVMAWAPLLLNMGIVDQDGYIKIETAAKKTMELVDNGQWRSATDQWEATIETSLTESMGVDFYNIQKPTKTDINKNMLLRSNNHRALIYRADVHESDDDDAKLEKLMRKNVTKVLGIRSPVEWGAQSESTFENLRGDFMKPVIDIVSELLDSTDIKVAVYSGQLDLICATAGTVNWIEKMQWNDKDKYVGTVRLGISVEGVLEGYEKSAGKFSMFWINRAGHSAPPENSAAMKYILQKITNYV